jgi:tetratricopeptide (TPR) repeat protein
MDRKQKFILIGMIMFVLSAMGVALYFSGADSGLREKLHTPKRFTAKPGTDRENAVALSSSKRPAQAPTGPPSNSGEPPIPVKSLSPPEEKLTPEEELIREALNGLDTQAGIEKIDAQLALPQSPEDAAQLHSARAQLALEMRPPDYVAAEAHFARALELAATGGLRYAILAREAEMWLMRDEPGAASEKLGAALEVPAALSVERMRLRALLAQALEKVGRVEAAEEEFGRLLAEALSYSDESTPEIDDLMRLAGLRLARIYRDAEREDDAAALESRIGERVRE